MQNQINTKESVSVAYDEIDTLKTRSRKRNWKPFAIKLPFLASIAVLCLICIVLLEVMVRRSTFLDKSLLEVSENLRRSVRVPVANIVTIREHARPVPALVARVTSVSDTPPSAEPTTDPSTSSAPPTESSPESSTKSNTSGSPAASILFPSSSDVMEIAGVTASSPASGSQVTISSLISLTSSPYLDITQLTNEPMNPSATETFIGIELTSAHLDPTSIYAPSAKQSSENLASTDHVQSISTTMAATVPAISSHQPLASTGVPPLRVTQLLISTIISGSPMVLTSSVTMSSPQTASITPTAARAGSTAVPNVSIDDAKPFTMISVFTSDNGRIVTSTTVVQPSTMISVFTAKDGRVTTSTTMVRASIMVSVFTAGNGQLTTSTAVIKPSAILSVFTASDGQLTTSTVVIQPQATSTDAQSSDSSIPQRNRYPTKPDLLLTDHVKPASYFVCLYVPSIIAITIKETWALTASGLKLMQPFYQLNRPEGANARKSLMADYVSGTDSLYSIVSVLKGNTLMLGIVVVNIIMNLLAPLSTEAMTILPTLITFDENGVRHITNPIWVLNQFFVRVLQIVLLITIFVIILIAIIDYRRRSGLSANPSKIVTMASLCNHPNMVHELHQIDQNASDKEIEAFMAHNRYKIADFQDQHGNDLYGLVKAGEITPQETHILPQEDISNPSGVAEMTSIEVRGHNQIKRAVWYKLVDGVLMFLITGLFAVIIAYYLDGTQSGFNRFFNSRTFGPKFILSLSASVTTTTFQSIEREVRLITPYRQLTARNASPRDTILRSVNGTAVSGLIQSIQHGAWFAFFVALVTVLGNVLIVVVTGVPLSANMTEGSYKVCTFASLTLTGFMLMAAIAVFFWRRQNKKMKIPSEPNRSLIRVWMSLSNPGNHLRALHNEPGNNSESSLRAHINNDEGRYWSGWICDDYGRNMWCVDKEQPLVQDAQHDGIRLRRRGTGFVNPYQKANTSQRRFSWRGPTMQTIPFIRTEDWGDTACRGLNSERHPRSEQPYSLVQTPYRDNSRDHSRDNSVDHGRGSPFLHPDTITPYEESDISDGEDIGHVQPHLQTGSHKDNSSRSRRTETAHLLRHK